MARFQVNTVVLNYHSLDSHMSTRLHNWAVKKAGKGKGEERIWKTRFIVVSGKCSVMMFNESL